MSELARIFPTNEILEKVPDLKITQLGRSEIRDIVRLKPQTMHEMGLSTWHAALMTNNFSVDPGALGKFVDEGDPNLLRRVAQKLGTKVIFDINYTYAECPGVELREPAAQILVAHLYPNRLHIGDVKLLNPHEPRISDVTNDDQTHNSLRLFGACMHNCISISRKIGVDKMTLTAANFDLTKTFGAYGFSVEDSEMGKMAVKFGFGIPMELIL